MYTMSKIEELLLKITNLKSSISTLNEFYFIKFFIRFCLINIFVF